MTFRKFPDHNQLEIQKCIVEFMILEGKNNKFMPS